MSRPRANFPRINEESEVDYLPPKRLVIDAETHAELSALLESPRAPNARLLALFKKLEVV